MFGFTFLIHAAFWNISTNYAGEKSGECCRIVLHSNWLVIDVLRTVCAKMLLFCRAMVFNPSVSCKSFCGLVLLSDRFRELCWGVGKWLLRAGPRLLDMRTAEVSAPGWVITISQCPSQMFKTELVCSPQTWKSVIVQPAFVCLCHLNSVEQRTEELYSLLT